ncbi:MAG: type II toxin-antitoxin system HigB family toxin [bacterium]|nr:type II toxin-antitoxin system HigB family toxin [bacterium]
MCNPKLVWLRPEAALRTIPTVFNIGRQVRLIVAVHYNRQRVYIRAVLRHDEYDKDKWKE